MILCSRSTPYWVSNGPTLGDPTPGSRPVIFPSESNRFDFWECIVSGLALPEAVATAPARFNNSVQPGSSSRPSTVPNCPFPFVPIPDHAHSRSCPSPPAHSDQAVAATFRKAPHMTRPATSTEIGRPAELAALTPQVHNPKRDKQSRHAMPLYSATPNPIRPQKLQRIGAGLILLL